LIFWFFFIKKKEQEVTSGIMGLITNNLNTAAIGETGVLAGVVDNLNTELAATALVNTQNTNAPKAYLQYILFDDAYEVVDHGYELVSSAASGAFETLNITASIESDGYLYAYLVNESEIDVHFDNLTVSVLGLQVQSRTEYYPYGLVLSEWKHEDADLYRFSFQGAYSERDTVTNWNHFQLREYDARLARWLIVDPYRQHYSPYLSYSNNPINVVDPDGGLDDHIYSVDKNGKVVLEVETCDNFDILVTKADFDLGDLSCGIEISNQNILSRLAQPRIDFKGYYTTSRTKSEMAELFYFVSNNTNVEWGFDAFQVRGTPLYAVRTSNNNSFVKTLYGVSGVDKFNLLWTIHSHPDPQGTAGASGYKNSMDMGNINRLKKQFDEMGIALPSHYVYFKKNSTLYQFTPDNPSIYVRPVKNACDF
jgi:RHS repeat-associated protein